MILKTETVKEPKKWYYSWFLPIKSAIFMVFTEPNWGLVPNWTS